MENIPSSEAMKSRVVQLYESDQAERMEYDGGDFSQIAKNDNARMGELLEILENANEFSPEENYAIAMLFQHGATSAEIEQAVSFAKRAMDAGYEDAKWLFAAATDRLLMTKDEDQLYGTQFKKKDGVWVLWPVVASVTDEERAQFNVPPLSDAIERAKQMNIKFR